MQRVLKSRIFKTVAAIAVFAVFSAIVMLSDISTSYIKYNIRFNGVEDGKTAVLTIKDRETGEEEVQESRIFNSQAEFRSWNSYNDFSNINIAVKDSDGILSVESLSVLSRDKVIEEFDKSRLGENLEAYENTVSGELAYDELFFEDSDQEINIALSEKYIDELELKLQNDWQLKLDIIYAVGAVLAFVLAAYWIISIVFSREKKKNNKLWIIPVLTAICTIVCGLIYFKAPDTEYTDSEHIHSDNVTGLVTGDEIYYQSFFADKTVKQIGVRFATYGSTVSGTYELKVYDCDTNKLVSVGRIIGSSVKDNLYYIVQLEDELRSGKEYKFTVICLNYEEVEGSDLLSIWRSDADAYDKGALYTFNEESEYDMNFKLGYEGPKTNIYAIAFIVLLFIATCAAIIYNSSEAKPRRMLVFIYAAILMICALKMSFYYQYSRLGIYDEMASISYVAYMEDTGKILPEYENMTMLVPYSYPMAEDPGNFYGLEQTSGIFNAKFSGTVDYLGHPPLYYWLMKLTNSVYIDKVSDMVEINLTRLRFVNMFMVLSAVFVLLYAGYKYMKSENAVTHLLYAALCTAVPMYCFLGVTITNDNLLALTVAVFLLGAVRFIEQKKDILTYIFIAFGVCGSMLTKTTAGLMLLAATAIFVIWHEIREKTAKDILNPGFIITLPVYVVTAAYFLYTHHIYGTFQPSLSSVAPEQYVRYPGVYVNVTQRTRLGFVEFVNYFKTTFFNQWVNGAAWNTQKSGLFCSIGNSLLILLLVLPLVFLVTKGVRNVKERFFASTAFAVIIVVFMQFVRAFNDFQFVSGHAGTQSRYYVCMAGVFAMAAAYLFEKLQKKSAGMIIVNKEKEEKGISLFAVINIIAIVAVWIIYYSDFLYLLLKEITFTS